MEEPKRRKGRPAGSTGKGVYGQLASIKLAEVKAKNEKRLALANLNAKGVFEGDVFSHLQNLIEKLVRQFINENAEGLFPVQWEDRDTVIRRKDQISLMREHMTLIKAIRNMALDFQHAPDEEEPELTPEAKALIDSAESLLSKRGMKVDLSPQEEEEQEEEEWEIADNLHSH